MNNLNNYDTIQASEDPRVLLYAHLIATEHKNRNSGFTDTKPFYLSKYKGGAVHNGKEKVRNSLKELTHNTISEARIDKILKFLGDEIMRFDIKESDYNHLGGFNIADSSRVFNSMIEAGNDTRKVANSLTASMPFTFGINTSNTAIQQYEKSTFDFLSEYELGVPTGSTLFNAGEILNIIEFGGDVTNITNGATTLGSASYNGEHTIAEYKTIGIAISDLISMIANSGSGFAGDNLIQSVFPQAMQTAKAKVLTTIMRDYYAGIADQSKGAGNFVPTYQLTDFDGGFASTSLTDVFSKSSKLGEFLTKVIPALTAPNNKFLETNQAMLSRIVMPTSFAGAWDRTPATYAFTGNTTGQASASGITLKDALPSVKAFFGGDINKTTYNASDRILCVADPNFAEFQSQLFGRFSWMVLALSPTLMANSTNLGFQDQALVARYTLPKVLLPKRACFITGSGD